MSYGQYRLDHLRCDQYFWESGNHGTARWFVWGKRKDGKTRSRPFQYSAVFAPVRTCQRCGLLGSPRRVSYRSDVYGWNKEHPRDWSAPDISTLCMSCWNKVRPVMKMKEQAAELKSANNALQRAYREAKRNLKKD